MSAMSCGEPRSLLRSMSPARETTVTECPSHSVLVRVCHAFPVAPGWTSITSSDEHLRVPGDDLGEPVHHDLALGQPNGCSLSSNEPVRQERFDDLLDRVRRCQEVDIDRRSRVRVDGHRDAPTDRIRNARGAQDAHDGSKLLEEIRHAALGERNTTLTRSRHRASVGASTRCPEGAGVSPRDSCAQETCAYTRVISSAVR